MATPAVQTSNLPEIKISKPTSPAYTESTQASVNPNFLYVVPLAAGNLDDLRNTTNETMKLRVETCRLNAVAAHKEALAANVQLKKKTFIIKLAIAVVASLIFLGSLAGTVASEGAAIPVTAGFGVIALLAISDACCAYKDWQLKKQGKPGLTFGPDWIANKMYQRMIRNGRSEEAAKKRASRVSMAVRLVFSFGALISVGEQHCVVEKFTNSVCGVETLMSPALDEAEDDGDADEARSEVELQKKTADLEQELLHTQQIASSAHNVAMNMASHRWKNDQQRIQDRINKNKAKLADIKKVIEAFKSQMQQTVAEHRPDLEDLLKGGVKELFKEEPTPTTHYHHYETTV